MPSTNIYHLPHIHKYLYLCDRIYTSTYIYACVCHNWDEEAREHGIGNFTCARGRGEASGKCPFSRVALTRRLSQSLYIYISEACVYTKCVYEVCVGGVYMRCVYIYISVVYI